ncbi:PAS domain-containing sensor histidine kinase [Streptomyces venezuelae]|uniref:PAS domain-containing sensor histidine kinase n=1 Tax=Streptomyces venezuelae TaxID=54571 RepID=UPI00278C4081|nr:PAS domain-containing sensor histidine kinase [Streptomyces venezuelae]
MHEVPPEQLPLAASLLDALPQAALLLDRDLRVVRVNRRCAALLRLTDLDLSPGTTRDRVVDHVAGLLARPEERRRLLEESGTHGPVTRTTDYHLKDGRTLRRRRSPVLDGEELLGHLWLIEDVTRRGEAEDGLYEQVRKLAALADDRAAFAGRALHELRTPLATVLSFAELLLDPAGGPLSQEQASYVDAIRRNALRMRSVAENLPRTAGGGPVAEPRLGQVLVHELIERVVLEALQRAEGAGPYVTAECPPTGPPLIADGGMLTGALEELLGNALRFTPEDGRVEVVGSIADDHWTIEVGDDGIGVPLEYHEEIFTPFVRAPNARRGGYPGTGLGLAGALDTVRLHGGTITVRDHDGRPGAVFTVRLPLPGRAS